AGTLTSIHSQATRALVSTVIQTERVPTVGAGRRRQIAVAVGVSAALALAIGGAFVGRSFGEPGGPGPVASASPALAAGPGSGAAEPGPERAPAIPAEPAARTTTPSEVAHEHEHEQHEEHAHPPDDEVPAQGPTLGPEEAPAIAEPAPSTRSRPKRRRDRPDPAIPALLEELSFQRAAF